MEKDNIGFEIKTVNNMIKRRVEMSEVKREIDNITGTHSQVVRYIAKHKGEDIFQRDLEEEFEIRRSTATGIINLMEKNGLVVREKVDYDARLKKLVLTDKALEINDIIDEDIIRIESLITRDISKEELAVFHKVIMKIKTNLNDDLKKKGGKVND